MLLLPNDSDQRRLKTVRWIEGLGHYLAPRFLHGESTFSTGPSHQNVRPFFSINAKRKQMPPQACGTKQYGNWN
jgi:hypothetical protein